MAAAAAERSSSTRFNNVQTTQVRIPNVLSFYLPVASTTIKLRAKARVTIQ